MTSRCAPPQHCTCHIDQKRDGVHHAAAVVQRLHLAIIGSCANAGPRTYKLASATCWPSGERRGQTSAQQGGDCARCSSITSIMWIARCTLAAAATGTNLWRDSDQHDYLYTQ